MRNVVRYALSLLPSFIKVAWLRRHGSVGKNVHIGFGSIIVAKRADIADDVRIGVGTHIVANYVKLGKRVWVGHRNQIRTNHFEMDNDSEVTYDVEIGGMDSPIAQCVVGKRSSIMAHTFINTTHPVWIGNDVGIGGYCLLFTHGSWQNALEGYPIQFGPIKICDGVWLPWDVFVFPNVTIGEGATIGARSLVVSDIPAHCLAMGQPAKIIKQFPDYPKKLSRDEKIEMVENILAEFIGYMIWKGITDIDRPVSETQGAAPYWILTRGVRFQNAAVCIGFNCPAPQFNAVVDLEKKTDTLNLRISWHHELRDFLGRYGIRTEHVET